VRWRPAALAGWVGLAGLIGLAAATSVLSALAVAALVGLFGVWLRRLGFAAELDLLRECRWGLEAGLAPRAPIGSDVWRQAQRIGLARRRKIIRNLNGLNRRRVRVSTSVFAA
jgi:hypothetical protein